MSANEATLRRLYHALDDRDGAAMAACYATDATFRDPVFPDLKGPEVGGMWRMLCSGATDLKAQLDHALADSDAASGQWTATYTFSRTGRPVRNVGTANFAMRDGLILHHVDSWSFWRWSRQALGPAGWLLGWTPFLRRKVQADAQARLQRFMAENPARPPTRPRAKRAAAGGKRPGPSARKRS